MKYKINGTEMYYDPIEDEIYTSAGVSKAGELDKTYMEKVGLTGGEKDDIQMLFFNSEIGRYVVNPDVIFKSKKVADLWIEVINMCTCSYEHKDKIILWLKDHVKEKKTKYKKSTYERQMRFLELEINDPRPAGVRMSYFEEAA